MGGLLVGAIMDLAWAEQHWDSKSADARNKLSRARQSIGSAVDLKRKLVERLRPSLLENVGLFAALRWHVKGVNDETGIDCQIDLPDTELHLSSEAAIMLFRSVQEAYGLFCAAQATGVKMVGRTDHGRLNLRIEAGSARRPHGNGQSQHALAAIRRRILSLGGNSSMQYPEGDEMSFTASVPIRNIVSK
jgi:signal transduction histidine kinase